MSLDNVKTEELLAEVANRGFIATKQEMLVDKTYKFPRQCKPFKLAVVSDTHFGSTQQQITLLHEAYRVCQEEDVRTVLHAGDLTEGNGKLHRGQVYEMFVHGADAIAKYTIEYYPRVQGITTHIIAGNHDHSFYKEDGTDIVARVAERRRDIKYLGTFGAYLKIGRISIYLMHGTSGNAYARSYRMQKIIEQFPPERKPNILFLGHYHTQNQLPNYRNVAGFQLPCFQSQTNYLRAKGLSPELGFLIVEIFPDAKGIFHYKTDWRPFYQPVDNDY